MENVVGVFRDRERARRAAEHLRQGRIPADRVNFLMPGTDALESIRTSDTEQPGMGKALGGVVGGTAGATAGMGLGAAAASLLIPGIGPVAAVGLAAAALFGVGGAIGGAAAGGKLEEKMSHGIPRDELYVYEDALRKGHSIVFVFADGEGEAEFARSVLEREGAESLDAARADWWVGLRDAEAAEYEKDGGHFSADEEPFRRGFTAALHPERRGRSWDEIRDELSRREPEYCDLPAYRRGFQRGSEHVRGLSQSYQRKGAEDLVEK
jgi:outer membrane lipoprotein SlyB